MMSYSYLSRTPRGDTEERERQRQTKRPYFPLPFSNPPANCAGTPPSLPFLSTDQSRFTRAHTWFLPPSQAPPGQNSHGSLPQYIHYFSMFTM